MPAASLFGGGKEITPLVREAWLLLPIVQERYLPLFAERIAKHFNAGHQWRAVLSGDIPADFLLTDDLASERENHNFDPDDEDDEPTYRSAREDFEELCIGVVRLAMREIHRESIARVPVDHFPACRWVKAPFDDCSAAVRNDGKAFPRSATPPLPAPDCSVRFCGCSWTLLSDHVGRSTSPA